MDSAGLFLSGYWKVKVLLSKFSLASYGLGFEASHNNAHASLPWRSCIDCRANVAARQARQVTLKMATRAKQRLQRYTVVKKRWIAIGGAKLQGDTRGGLRCEGCLADLTTSGKLKSQLPVVPVKATARSTL